MNFFSRNWLWICLGLLVAVKTGALRALAVKLGLAWGPVGQPSGVTSFRTIGGKTVVAPDDITLGVPASVTDGGEWGAGAIRYDGRDYGLNVQT